MNAYEVKAGMVCLQCKNCTIHTERFRGEFLTMGRYTNLYLYLFTTFTLRSSVNRRNCIISLRNSTAIEDYSDPGEQGAEGRTFHICFAKRSPPLRR